jgi:hypothetical protein
MNTYQIDTSIKLQGIFVDDVGLTADPTTIALFVRPPAGAVRTFNFPADVTKDRTGVYSIVITPEISGQWTYQWQGAGAVVATSPETPFKIAPTTLIS